MLRGQDKTGHVHQDDHCEEEAIGRTIGSLRSKKNEVEKIFRLTGLSIGSCLDSGFILWIMVFCCLEILSNFLPVLYKAQLLHRLALQDIMDLGSTTFPRLWKQRLFELHHQPRLTVRAVVRSKSQQISFGDMKNDLVSLWQKMIKRMMNSDEPCHVSKTGGQYPTHIQRSVWRNMDNPWIPKVEAPGLHLRGKAISKESGGAEARQMCNSSWV